MSEKIIVQSSHIFRELKSMPDNTTCIKYIHSLGYVDLHNLIAMHPRELQKMRLHDITCIQLVHHIKNNFGVKIRTDSIYNYAIDVCNKKIIDYLDNLL